IKTVNNHLDTLLNITNQRFDTMVDHFLLTITNNLYDYDEEQFTLIKIVKKNAPQIEEDAFSIFNGDSTEVEIYNNNPGFMGIVRKKLDRKSKRLNSSHVSRSY